MNKLDRDIIKFIKQIRADMVAKYQKLFNYLKQNRIVVFENSNWNCLCESDFRAFGADAKLYMKSLRDITITKLNDYVINELINCPNDLAYVTKDELKEFETVTYPKLYAKWLAEQNQKRAAKRAKNAKDASKIRAKIEKLQRKLNDIEA